MAEGASNSDILGQYRAISNKLKKRFLRKPNVTEAGEQFSALALRCEREAMPQYAGMCWMAAARCEGSLHNTPGEAWDLARAGRQFLSAEVKTHKLGLPSLNGENLQAATNCFTHAANRWQHHHHTETMPGLSPSNCPLSVSLYQELANTMADDLDRTSEAANLYRYAADMQHNSPLDQLHTLGKLVTCKIKLDDYHDALQILNEMAEIADINEPPYNGAYVDIFRRIEVTRVLLLLILQPSPQTLSPDLAEILEKYAWGDGNSIPASFLMEDESILLQSLVMACQSCDLDALILLEKDLWCYFSGEQRDLMRLLVNQMAAIPK